MVQARQADRRVPVQHRLITHHYGENYWFNGAARYVMECLGEREYDYWLFAGLTGDVLAQVFSRDGFRGDGATDYRLSDPAHHNFAEEAFRACGYEAQYVAEAELKRHLDAYIQRLMDSIDQGVPVIRFHYSWGVIVGYEGYGKRFLWRTDDHEQPEMVDAEQLFALPENFTEEAAVRSHWGWLFVGEKFREVPIKQVYRQAVNAMPALFSTDTGAYCFGSAAFRAWADEVESGGKFAGMRPEQFDQWADYTIYVCNMATNAACSWCFLDKALEWNPDLAFLREIRAIYKERMEALWKDGQGHDLEAVGGGFNIELTTLQDAARRAQIAGILREFAAEAEKIEAIVRENLPRE